MNPNKAEEVANNRKRVRDAIREAFPSDAYKVFDDENLDKLYKKYCFSVATLRSPRILRSLNEEPDKVHPNLVAILEEEAAKVTERPLYAAARSYTKVLRDWETADSGMHFKVHKFLHEFAEGAERFRDFWAIHQATFKSMSIKLRVCLSEKTIDSYQDCGNKMEQILFKVMHAAMGFKGNDRTGQSLLRFFFNQGDDTRPDVAACGKDAGVEISADQLYKFMVLVAELKPDLTNASARKNLVDGMGEVIARADQARDERGAQDFILPGMVTDNRLLRAMVVHASQRRKQQYLEIGESLVWLMPENSPKDDALGQAVDTNGNAFKEVVFLCWRAAELRLRATAESPKLDIPKDGLHISVRASDGASFSFLLQKQLAEPGAPYLVCAAAALHDGADVIVKIGPPSGTVAGAKGLAVSVEEFLQVERETMMLQRLRLHETPVLPHLVCGGQLEGSSVACLLGRSVVVTLRHGHPLIGPDGALPVLAPHALLRLAADVLAGIKELQAVSISHNDLRPQNLGASKTGYYIYDLGAASLLNAEEPDRQHACSLQYSSTRIIQGKDPSAISDVETLVYLLIKLNGDPLLWEVAAAEGDWLGCLTARLQLARSRVLPESIQNLPFPLPAFARRVLQCVAKGGSASWIAGWVSHLRAVAARREQEALVTGPGVATASTVYLAPPPTSSELVLAATQACSIPRDPFSSSMLTGREGVMTATRHDGAELDAAQTELHARSKEADGPREEYCGMAQRLEALQGASDREKEAGGKHRIIPLVL